MLRWLGSTLAALCLWAIATGVPADSWHKEPAHTVAPSTPVPAFSASSTIHGIDRARQCSDGSLVLTDRISGTGMIQAGHVFIEGVLSPGNSPGCINFGGNVTFGITSTLVSEIGGTTPCTEYDRVDVANQLTINGATLEVILLNGFVPAYGDSFDVLDWGSLTGTFGTIDTTAATLPYPLQWDTSLLYLTGELVAVVQHVGDGDLAPWNSPNGEVNAADYLIATQLIIGMRTPGALQYAHGDMDGDGDIDIADLLQIQQMVLQ